MRGGYTTEFLSTPSARRATPSLVGPARSPRYFYPRPPRGGRLQTVIYTCTTTNFYPRPPRGGRPGAVGREFRHEAISIHALREEGDEALRERRCPVCNFYPRPPRGGRRSDAVVLLFGTIFLSTPSARRATTQFSDTITTAIFLSTPSARRATVGGWVRDGTKSDFYPRPPRGGRRESAPLFSCQN